MGSSDQHFLQTPRAAGRAWSGSVWPASVGTATQGPLHARSTAIFSRARSPPCYLPSLRLLLWISCLSHISCLPQTLPDPQRGAKCPGHPLLPAQLASLPLPASHAPTVERAGEPWEEGTPELPGPRGRPQPQGAASRRWAGQRVSWEGEPRSRNLSHLHLVIGLFLGPQPPTFLWASIQSARPGMRRQGGPHHHSVRRAATRIPHCCDVQTPGAGLWFPAAAPALSCSVSDQEAQVPMGQPLACPGQTWPCPALKARPPPAQGRLCLPQDTALPPAVPAETLCSPGPPTTCMA